MAVASLSPQVKNLRDRMCDQVCASSVKKNIGRSSDTVLVKASLEDRFGLIVHIFSTLFVGYGWRLGLVMMTLLPALVFSGMYEMFALRGYTQEDEEALRGAASVLTESINRIRTVTAFALQNKVVTLSGYRFLYTLSVNPVSSHTKSLP